MSNQLAVKIERLKSLVNENVELHVEGAHFRGIITAVTNYEVTLGVAYNKVFVFVEDVTMVVLLDSRGWKDSL